ncbi:helix-turn-helix domain-containing protein [Streptomyces sp. NBC_01244]|uniref:helix-turn-helix domain-containing protein n=1 Tax=Streptomyces sp. NBC_01244 TaxID=2903797 RepID=UPI002E0D2B49|nr:helix-turn-helix domain containing protein [Streptomyces sp. NBC_01244]
MPVFTSEHEPDTEHEPKVSHKKVDAYLQAHRLQIMRRHLRGQKIRSIAEHYEVSVTVMTRRIDKWEHDGELVRAAQFPAPRPRFTRAALAPVEPPAWLYTGDDADLY